MRHSPARRPSLLRPVLNVIRQPWLWFGILVVYFIYNVVNTAKLQETHRNLQNRLEEAVRKESQDPSHLEHFQFVHTHPVVDRDFAAAALAQQNPHDNAIVTSLYTDAYAVPVATLGESLNRVNSSARRIMFYLPDRVSERALCIATMTGWEAYPVTRIDPPDGGTGVMGHFVDQFTKLTIWNFDRLGVRALVYLDADTLALRNFDELFTLPFNLGAVQDVNAYGDHRPFTTNFNAGVLFVRPNSGTFRDLVKKMHTTTFSRWDAEQGFLNVFYGPQIARLPLIYNGNLGIKQRAPMMWRALQNEMRIVHFTVVKPFWRKADYDNIAIEKIHEHARAQAKEWGGNFEFEILWWDQLWRETEEKYGKELMTCGWKPSSIKVPHPTAA